MNTITAIADADDSHRVIEFPVGAYRQEGWQIYDLICARMQTGEFL